MVYYISAQPDDLFFKWQIEVQLFNFQKHKIPAENIHVLIAFNPQIGINPVFIALAREQSEKACFFFYEDNRKERNYISALRPHVLKKHFAAYPSLTDEHIFYHDSDIIFRELPDFERLCRRNVWSLSDTNNYISAKAIKKHGHVVFQEMCDLLDVSEALIEQNDDHAGGAQYLLSSVNYQFWDKVEQDSETLYTYLERNQERYIQAYRENNSAVPADYRGMQYWCADMWALLWNALTMGYNVTVDKELDFCWPTDPIERWMHTKIFHNAGITKAQSSQYFFKSAFDETPPYGLSFDHVLHDRCSIKYVDAIKEYEASIVSGAVSS
ncbi:hypothetical protein ACTJJ0_09290 [Chitinophaga sp. 22321]|uniref:Rhamnan synthesis protein F n=1 Tax=Chitinophaga hostae TaxID=2831022 RepID=A0ABS5IU06_9BACT|nr:hypothetical protein [Chitinophaga hostae]MBS0025737.1 hypothetical protein [Chitinophaga hostae]